MTTTATTHAPAPPLPAAASILDHLCVGAPLSSPGPVQIKGVPYLPIAIDNGNDAAKVVLFDPAGQLRTFRFPTAHNAARRFQGGVGEVSYQIGGSTAFWIGEAALRNEGRALPVGSTAQRIPDQRQRQFMVACLVEALHGAGYAPGAYTLALGCAIPNTEIVRDADDPDALTIAPETRSVLKAHLRGAQWTITRTDARGQAAAWDLTIGQLMPQAQSLGTFVCWARAPNGKTVTPYDAVSVLDLGGGDVHRTDITIKPYRMTTERLGDGTIDIARALKTRLPQARLNDVTAQHALVTRHTLIGGKVQDIGAHVDAVIETYGQDLIGLILPVLQQTRRYVILTGGGTILLHPMLTERLAAARAAEAQDYVIVPARLAASLNAIGALFAILFLAARR